MNGMFIARKKEQAGLKDEEMKLWEKLLKPLARNGIKMEGMKLTKTVGLIFIQIRHFFQNYSINYYRNITPRFLFFIVCF